MNTFYKKGVSLFALLFILFSGSNIHASPVIMAELTRILRSRIGQIILESDAGKALARKIIGSRLANSTTTQNLPNSLVLGIQHRGKMHFAEDLYLRLLRIKDHTHTFQQNNMLFRKWLSDRRLLNEVNKVHGSETGPFNRRRGILRIAIRQLAADELTLRRLPFIRTRLFAFLESRPFGNPHNITYSANSRSFINRHDQIRGAWGRSLHFLENNKGILDAIIKQTTQGRDLMDTLSLMLPKRFGNPQRISSADELLEILRNHQDLLKPFTIEFTYRFNRILNSSGINSRNTVSLIPEKLETLNTNVSLALRHDLTDPQYLRFQANRIPFTSQSPRISNNREIEPPLFGDFQ